MPKKWVIWIQMTQDLQNIFTLRTPEDAANIAALAKKGQKMIEPRSESGPGWWDLDGYHGYYCRCPRCSCDLSVPSTKLKWGAADEPGAYPSAISYMENWKKNQPTYLSYMNMFLFNLWFCKLTDQMPDVKFHQFDPNWSISIHQPFGQVVGGSFIGMEVASSLAKKGCDVAVIAMETVPFERVLGKKVGASFARKLQKEGRRRLQRLGWKLGATAWLEVGTCWNLFHVFFKNPSVFYIGPYLNDMSFVFFFSSWALTFIMFFQYFQGFSRKKCSRKIMETFSCIFFLHMVQRWLIHDMINLEDGSGFQFFF